MKTIILGGFLGSGKTSVLLQFARYLVDSSGAESENKVVILENEVSATGIDNQLLSSASFTVENIFSGCICCTSVGQLSGAVSRIKEQYHPEWLIVEATGMAYPDSIREALCQEGQKSPSIIALADAKRWFRLERAMPDFVTSQLQDAEVILLNKIDLVDEEEREKIRAKLCSANETALIKEICAIREQPEEFWEELLKRTESGE